MPEDKRPPAQFTVIGVQPPAPGVIAAPTAPAPAAGFAPTVIGGVSPGVDNAPHVAKPTVIGGVAQPAPPVTPTATVMGAKPVERLGPLASDIGVSTPSASAKAPGAVPLSASVMPGVIRKGLEVQLADLEKAFPGTARQTCERAVQILAGTVTETLSSIACSQWGQGAQLRYQKLVNDSLSLTTTGAARDGTQHLTRLYHILEDLAAAFANHDSKGLRFWEKKRTPGDVLQSHRDELDQLRHHLEQSLPLLREQQTRLAGISVQAQQVSDEMDAWSIAARYLADWLGPSHELSGHLAMQGMSLTRTMAQIQEGNLLRQSHTRSVDALADRIQDSVLVMLPGWLERFGLLANSPSMTETDNYALRQSLQDILTQLQ